MEQHGPIQHDNERAARRLRALELRSQGWSRKKIAITLEVAPETVSRWLRQVDAEGVEALTDKGVGRKSRLSKPQQKRLLELLTKGAEQAGFWSDVWTETRICQVIEQEFGIVYSPRYIWKLLDQLGGFWDTPAQQAHRRQVMKIIRQYPDIWANAETIFNEQSTDQE
ncbi:hypothetical protein BH10CHL1_BH10CHL1_35970 [soil metagenome]